MGQAGWDFNGSNSLPAGWLTEGSGGSWSIVPSQGGSGNALFAGSDGEMLPVDQGVQRNLYAWSPEFVFDDILSTLISFDVDNFDFSPDVDPFQGMEVHLYQVGSASTLEELSDLDPVAVLWQRLFDFPLPDLPINVGEKVGSPPPGHVDGETLFRVRMRVFDGDMDPNSLVGVQLDNLLIAPDDFLRGDYNEDGRVDAADYTLWRDTLGQSVSGGFAGADGSGNGLIDQSDYEYWRQNFGQTSSAGSLLVVAGGKAVPEPSSLMLVTPVVLLLACRVTYPALAASCVRCESLSPGRLALGRHVSLARG